MIWTALDDAAGSVFVDARKGLELGLGGRVHVHRLVRRGQTLLHAFCNGFALYRSLLGIFLQLNGRNLAAFLDLLCGFGGFLLGFFRVLVGAGGDQQKTRCERAR